MELAAKKARGRRRRRRRRRTRGPAGRRAPGPRRRSTRETDANSHRALSETMYLVERGGDETRRVRATAAYMPPLRHVFAVLGSTGNAYDVAVQKEPACTCPYAVSHPTKVCKHRYFVWYRVLKIPRDDDQRCSESDAHLKHVPHQRYLRRDELQTVLVDRAASAAPMASRAARDAYRRASGDVIDVDASDEEREVPRRPLDECTVMLRGLQRRRRTYFCGACGRNYHEACRDRWFAFKKARRVCGVRGALAKPRCVAPDAAVAREEGYGTCGPSSRTSARERSISAAPRRTTAGSGSDVHADRADAGGTNSLLRRLGRSSAAGSPRGHKHRRTQASKLFDDALPEKKTRFSHASVHFYQLCALDVERCKSYFPRPPNHGCWPATCTYEEHDEGAPSVQHECQPRKPVRYTTRCSLLVRGN